MISFCRRLYKFSSTWPWTVRLQFVNCRLCLYLTCMGVFSLKMLSARVLLVFCLTSLTSPLMLPKLPQLVFFFTLLMLVSEE